MWEWLVANNALINSVSSIAVCISVIFIGAQTRGFFNDCEKRNKKSEFENSFKLTSFYINDIIPRMELILNILQEVGVDKMIHQNLKGKKLQKFDKEEFKDFFNNVTIDTITQTINSIPLKNIVSCFGKVNYHEVCGVELDFYNYKMFCSQNDPQDNNVEERYRVYLLNRFWKEVSNTKNNLEYFSMYFNSNLAKSDAVYESLHQTFTDFVKFLYPFIADYNKRDDYTRKYFTHIKELYCTWTDKESSKVEETRKTMESISIKDSKRRKIC